MARKRSTRHRAPSLASQTTQKPPRDRDRGEPFNNPFKGLKADLPHGPVNGSVDSPDEEGAAKARDVSGGVRSPSQDANPAVRPEAAASLEQVSRGDQATFEDRGMGSDAVLFWQEMSGVERLEQDGSPGRVPYPSTPLSGRSRNEDDETIAALMDLVEGQGAFDISDTEEYVEGIARGLDRRLLRRLRRGEYSVQAHLDLHGMVRDEAKNRVRAFLLDARGKGLRCVLVVSGRGRHSEGKDPVLKRELVGWLTHKSLGRHVLAFCSARPCDGGAGAVYVLLRRPGPNVTQS